MSKPILPVIAGPTASGKTACAVSLCLRIGGEVVSADSMQVYRGMKVLSAQPGDEEIRGVPHHLLGCVEPSERFTADAYGSAAKACIAGIRARGNVPMLCGGTGLYIDAVTRPMSFSRRSDPQMHEALLALADAPGGREQLFEMLRKVDPESASRLHPNDVRRVSRAIEIYRLTGMTQMEHVRRDREREGEFRELIFGLEWPRELLYQRINARVDRMLEDGLVDEVRALLSDPRFHPTAMQAIGYKEIAAALQGGISMDEAVWRTKQASRNLAKRQMTWFRRDPRVIWLDARDTAPEALAEQMIRILNERFGTDFGR